MPWIEVSPINFISLIRDISPASVQVGMKSSQRIKIDTEKLKASSKFETGVTHVLGADLNSVRDKFTVSTPTAGGNIIGLKLLGSQID